MVVEGYRFEAPGPGAWEADAVHFDRPIFGVFPEVFFGLCEGTRDGFARHGLLVDSLALAWVNGVPYTQPVPLLGRAGAAPPPTWALRPMLTIAGWLCPEVRRRLATAATLFERRPWRDRLREWDETLKPRTVAAHASFDAVDPGTLDDAALVDHLDALVEHARRTLAQDHSLTLTYMVPVGDFLAHARRWTGLTSAELLLLLAGWSPISRGDAPERARLVRALRADAGARAWLDGGAAPEDALAALRAWPGAVGEATRAFLLVFGNALLHGFDVAQPTVAEAPGPMLEALARS
ncbi:MAG: hypothetical protein ACK4YP_25010, partial [Myxococcota bacterium]